MYYTILFFIPWLGLPVWSTVCTSIWHRFCVRCPSWCNPSQFWSVLGPVRVELPLQPQWLRFYGHCWSSVSNDTSTYGPEESGHEPLGDHWVDQPHTWPYFTILYYTIGFMVCAAILEWKIHFKKCVLDCPWVQTKPRPDNRDAVKLPQEDFSHQTS